VTLQITSNGLRITLADGQLRLWPYDEIRQVPRHQEGEPLRFERAGTLAETVLILDAEFLPALRQAAPQLRKRLRGPVRRGTALKVVVLASTALVLLVSALYFWIIPTFADQVAPRIPPAWERALGESVTAQIAPASARCSDRELQEALQSIVARLEQSAPKTSYVFRVGAVNQPLVNALAAPGGYILVYRGLLEKTTSPEELAGVLAHEMQHVIQRHTTRALVRHMSWRLLLAMVAGGQTPAQLAGQIGEMRFSREAEMEADREGMRLIQGARIDPNAMIRIYVTLREEGLRMPRFVQYLSTHPDIEERIALLRSLASTAQYEPVPLTTEIPWSSLTARCRLRTP
jgi:predicted Zn-dependent protease